MEVPMPMIAFSIPILPGKTDAFRAAYHRFVVNRRTEFEISRRRLGITAERGFLQHTPNGDLATVVFDVIDPSRMLAGTASSTEPLDADFRGYLLDVFGLDLTQAPTAQPSEQVFDWCAEESR
jgi:hypothetical protein